MTSLRLIPVNRDQALAFVDQVHRHLSRPTGYRFAVGVADGDRLAGVALAGRPISRTLDDGATIEVIRVAVTDGSRHACSMLYGACWRAARALGYTRAVTYTQGDEPGTSVRAAGWLLAAALEPRSGWDTPSRRRRDRGADGVGRQRWEIRAEAHVPVAIVTPAELAVPDPQLPLDLAAVAA